MFGLGLITQLLFLHSGLSSHAAVAPLSRRMSNAPRFERPAHDATPASAVEAA